MSNIDFLTNEEIEFIERTIIFPDFTDEKTLNCFSWWNKLVLKVVNKTANQDEMLQYDRIRDIENLVTLLKGDIPDSILQYLEIMDTLDEREKTFLLKAMVEINMHEEENKFNLECLKKTLKEDYEQDLNEPFIENFINEAQNEYVEQQKYERMYETIENMEFENLNDNIMLEFCLLLFKGLDDENNKLSNGIKQIDKKIVSYLIFKYSSKISMTVEDDNPSKKME